MKLIKEYLKRRKVEKHNKLLFGQVPDNLRTLNRYLDLIQDIGNENMLKKVESLMLRYPPVLSENTGKHIYYVSIGLKEIYEEYNDE